jgi:hypothetical protein
MDFPRELIAAIDRAVVVVGRNAHPLRFVSADADRGSSSTTPMVVTVETVYGGELVRATCSFAPSDLNDVPFVVRCMVNRMRGVLTAASERRR